jgi:hypothetical protein
MAFQAVGWILLSGAALENQLTNGERSTSTMRENDRHGYFAFALYSLCAIMAFWFPLAIAIVTTMIWIFWLAYGISIKHE